MSDVAFGNVIPIDAEVARQLARRQVAFRWLVAGLAALWLAILVPTVLFTPLPPLGPFLALAVLVVLAEHRFVLFGDETSMSASIIVIVASIFVFADTSPLAGPLLVASIGGVYIPHLRSRSASKVAFNGTAMGISGWSASAATLAFSSYVPTSLLEPPLVLAAVLVYWTLNNLVVAGHQSTLCGEKFFRSAKTLVSADTDALLWAGAGGMAVLTAGDRTAAAVAFVGCVVTLRVVAMNANSKLRLASGYRTVELRLVYWLSLIPLLTLPGTFNAGTAALALSVSFLLGRRSSHPNPLMAVWLPLLPILLVNAGVVALSCIGLAAIAMAARSRSAADAWTFSVMLGASVASASIGLWQPALHASFAIAMVYATLVPLATSAMFSILVVRRTQAVDFWVAVGMIIPTSRDLVTVAMTALVAYGTAYTPLLTLGAVTAFFAAAAGVPLSLTQEVR